MPDFDAYIEPQKAFADYVIEVLPTDLDREDKKTLKVRAIQKKGVPDFNPTYLFDEGSEITWTPSTEKLSTPAPGLRLKSTQETYYVTTSPSWRWMERSTTSRSWSTSSPTSEALTRSST